MASDTPPTPPTSPDFLISGSDYMAAHPEFKMIGRQDELNAAMDILLRKSTGNNLILHGYRGGGLSSIIMGIQASKEDPATPFDIVGKSFYYLDVNSLFATTDSTAVNAGFEKAMDTLQNSKDAVLVIDDTKGFLDGIRNSSSQNIVNVLMHAVRTNPHFQVIFNTSTDDLPALLEAHTDINKIFTRLDIDQPLPEDLRAIIEHAAKNMGEQYGVTISKEAIDTVLELTNKYSNLQMPSAQPKRSLIILEGALTAYLRTALARPPELDALEKTLEEATTALTSGTAVEEGDLAGKSQEELAAVRLETENTIKEVTQGWDALQKEIRVLRAEQIKGTNLIREANAAILAQREKEAAAKVTLEQARADYKAVEADEELDEDTKKKNQQQIMADYKEKNKETLTFEDKKTEAQSQAANFKKMAGRVAPSEEVRALENDLKVYKEAFAKSEADYAELTKDISANLALTDAHVLAEFSRLSGVPMTKLRQDETDKLLHLEDTIKARVFGQDAPAEALADAVISAKAGLKGPTEPIGNFLFLGPSGVGKTEMAKALASALFGSDAALQTYSMSEYKQDTAINVLIGSPPGYQGADNGGILTNNMKQKPYCVNLFDEIEKADKLVFDIFLQIFDEGMLTDRRGMKVSFANAVNIMTSNIGSKYFLDENMDFAEAKKKALADLWNPNGDPNDPNSQGGFRPEFLNRITGIFCFNRLGEPEIIKISDKYLKQLNELAADKGISIVMPDEAVKAMCEQQYDPKTGGRGIQNYIKGTIRKDAAKTVLKNADIHGTVQVAYTPGKVAAEDVQKIEAEVEAATRAEIEEAVEQSGKTVKPEQIEKVIKEQVEETVKEKVRDKERESAVVSTKFIPEGAVKPAQTAANSNTKKTDKPSFG